MGDLSDYYDDELEYDDELDFGDDTTSISSGSKRKPYRVFTYDQLHNEMDNIAAEVSAVVALPKAASRTLLHHFKWNKNTLIESFYEIADLTKYGIMRNRRSDGAILHNSTNSCCLICDVDGKMKGLDCAHTFCVDCWQMYLETKIVSDGVAQILCPASKCPIIVPDEVIVKLIHRPDVRTKFLQLTTNDFVKSNRQLAFCPAKGCELACKADSEGCQPVTCDCGEVYCLACSQPWHGPISCELLAAWTKQCNSDGETFNWITAYTKDCPNCKSPIEKNGGCNHMHCKKCEHHFCWTCMQNWGVHGYSNCNRYEVSDEYEKKISSTRESIERYMHYYNRFRNHENSLKLEAKLYETINVKAEMFSNVQGVGLQETRFLTDSVNVLGTCRRMLMFTYAFAFYLKKTNITKIFEDNQQDLELATEALSDLLENQLNEQTNFMDMRQQVKDKTGYLNKRCEILIQHCKEGTEYDVWEYNNVDITIGTIPPY